MIKALIGLGNPGHRFENTRHNIGFRVLDALADEHNASWRCKDLVCTASIMIHDQSVLLVKPQTYMNTTGNITPWLAKQGVKPEETLVIHDELEKPFGKLAIRQGGSARGHNGLKSLMQQFGSDFHRLRFGIDRPEDRDDVSQYVLSNFSREEAAQLPVKLQEATQLITDLFK